MYKGRNKLQVWIKLQRKIKSVNFRIEEATCENTRRRLLRKLKILVNRLFTLNRKWRVGIAAATLLLWLGNQNINAQTVFDHTNLDGANGFKIVDTNNIGKLGYDISSAGDFNGDGLQDMIISSCDKDIDKPGGAHVVFGTGGSFPSVLDVSTLDGSNGFQISEDINNNSTGVSVSSAGDFNGDGFDDLIIGESLHNYSSGRVYVLFGNNQNLAEVNLNALNGTNGFQINADATLGPFGRQLYFLGESVAGIGDINKDGYDDIAFSWAFQLEYGYVNILYGSGSTLDPANHVDALVALNRLSVLKAPFAIAYHGLGGDPNNDAISHGDINGDGFEDVVIGHASMNGDDGAVYAIFGKGQQLPDTLDLNALDGQTGFQLAGYEYYGYMGTNVDVADINGDGFDDILAGNYVNGENYYNAKATVLFGKGTAFSSIIQASDLNGSDGFEITGLNPDKDYSAVSVAAIDDVNGDGIDDIMIGVDDIMVNSMDDAGQIHVVFGNKDAWPANYDINTLNGDTGFIINGTAVNERIGSNVAGIGDINGDGAGDFAFAGSQGVEAFVIFGTPSDPVAFDALDPDKGFSVISDNPGGHKEIAFGDFNGDGLDDFVFSSYNNDGQILFGTNTPAAPLINLDTLDGTDGFSASTIESNYDVAFIDMNADGFDDIVFGQAYAGVNDGGRNYVLLGHDGSQEAVVDLENPGTNQLMNIHSSEDNYMLGYEVFNGGDINGDGFDDLYSVSYDDGYYGSVVFANNSLPASLDLATDMNPSLGFTIYYPRTQFHKGDINGDGKSDIITWSTGHHEVTFGQETGVLDLVNYPGGPDAFDGTDGFQISTWSANQYVRNLDIILDFNNDGYDDMLFHEPDRDSLHIVFGHAVPFPSYMILDSQENNLDGTNGTYITGLPAGEIINSVTALDFNNDESDDVVISLSPSNEVYVVYGNDNGGVSTDISNLQASQGFKITGFNDNALAVHKGGDLNGDGYDDLIVMDSLSSKVAARIIHGQVATNTVYTVAQLQSNGAYDLVFEENIQYENDVDNNNYFFQIENPDFNGDGYADAVFAIHENGGNSTFKFLLSEKQCAPTETFEDITVCLGEDYTCPDGTIIADITKNLSYVSNLISKVSGCDSLVTSNIVVNEINTNVSTEGNTLTAEEAQADSYQWLDCDLNKVPIDGATNFEFDAPKSGDYALVIEKDGCSETSDCITLVITGMEDIGNMVQRIWPNPSSGNVNIHLNDRNQKLELFIQDISGRVLLHKDVAPGETIFTTELPAASGVYFIQLISNLKTATYKVIKK